MKYTLIIAGAALLTGGAANAEVVVVAGVPVAHVAYGDLNLSSNDGRDKLRARIRGAARNVCSIDSSANALWEENFKSNCYTASTRDGYRQMSRAIAARQSGTSLASATLAIRGH